MEVVKYTRVSLHTVNAVKCVEKLWNSSPRLIWVQPPNKFVGKTDQGPYVGICSVVARATREMGAALRQVGARGAVSVHPHVLILFAIAFT